LDNFEDILLKSKQSNGGTIHLFYGAPGAGKSALLAYCERIALGDEWETAEVTCAALHKPSELLTALGREKEPIGTETTHGVDAKIYQGTVTRTRTDRTVRSILTDGDHPLLLLFDEAQTLGYGDDPPSEANRPILKGTLELIHNGRLGRPVVLLAAGVRTALDALDGLSLTRFGEENTDKLGSMSRETARAVIRDWIVEDGGCKGDPLEWIDAIEEEVAGHWPRHVHSYAKRAGEYLHANGGVMTPKGLSIVMEKGLAGRIQYYKQRLRNFYIDQIRHVARAISGYPPGTPFDQLDIIAHLSSVCPKKPTFSRV